MNDIISSFSITEWPINKISELFRPKTFVCRRQFILICSKLIYGNKKRNACSLHRYKLIPRRINTWINNEPSAGIKSLFRFIVNNSIAFPGTPVLTSGISRRSRLNALMVKLNEKLLFSNNKQGIRYSRL